MGTVRPRLSSSSSNRLRNVPSYLRTSTRSLWILAVLIAAVVTGVSLYPRHSARSDVASYIKRVNTTGAAFAAQYKDVSAAYRTLSLAPRDPAAQLVRLRAAAGQLTVLRRELERVPAPPAARTLRRRLIAFYREQEQVAHELPAILAYFPAVAAAEQPVRPAANRMKAALAGARTPKAQAALLKTYAGIVTFAAASVETVAAPPLLAPARAAEAARLRKTAGSIENAVAGLLAHDQSRLKRAVAALGVTNDAAGRANRAAILAYDQHIVEIRRLGARVEQERRRLETSLG